MNVIDDTDIDDIEGLEAWKNVARGTFVIRRFGARPGATTDQVVKGGHAFHLLPEERRLNQRKVARPERDPFTNGNFVHIHLIESESDTAKLLANSKGVTEDDLVNVFALDGAAFDARVDDITERVTLNRLLDIGRFLDVRGSQLLKIEERIEATKPKGRSANPSRGEPKAGDPQQ